MQYLWCPLCNGVVENVTCFVDIPKGQRCVEGSIFQNQFKDMKDFHFAETWYKVRMTCSTVETNHF